MKEQILPADQYKNSKATLIEVLETWSQTIENYQNEYNRKNETLIYAWTDTYKDMMQHLKSDRNKTDCFLVADSNDELQGLAFGIKLSHGNFSDAVQGIKKSSYHVLDILIAPWNIVGRAFAPKSEENDTLLEDEYKKIGTRLLKLITKHAETVNATQLVAEPTPAFEVGDFFKAVFFTQSYVQVGLAYELPQSEFGKVNTLITDEEPCITVYGAFFSFAVQDNYCPLSNEEESSLGFYR